MVQPRSNCNDCYFCCDPIDDIPGCKNPVRVDAPQTLKLIARLAHVLLSIVDGDICDYFAYETHDEWVSPCNEIAFQMNNKKWYKIFGNQNRPQKPCPYCARRIVLQEAEEYVNARTSK